MPIIGTIASSKYIVPIPANGYESLQTITLGSASSSVAFTGLVAAYGTTYRNFQLRIKVRTSVSFNDFIYCTINSTYSGNYAYSTGGYSGANIYNSNFTNQIGIYCGGMPKNSLASQIWGMQVIDFYDVTSNVGTKTKAGRSLGGYADTAGTAAYSTLIATAGNVTSPIDSLTFTTLQSANFIAGSKFALYGIKVS